ncbi:MAG: hypothetical protein ACYTBS_15400 [Planctomycetota bacterium]
MQRQLDLWLSLQKPPQWQDIWEGLDHQQRTTLIAALARLISKVVYPGDLNENQEKTDER